MVECTTDAQLEQQERQLQDYHERRALERRYAGPMADQEARDRQYAAAHDRQPQVPCPLCASAGTPARCPLRHWHRRARWNPRTWRWDTDGTWLVPQSVARRAVRKGRENMKVCHWCGQELRFAIGRGWGHLEGGGYMQRCKACGHKAALYPSPKACPKCGATREWVDDHAALPVEATQEA